MDEKHQHTMMLSIVGIVAVVGILGLGFAVIGTSSTQEALTGNAMCGTYCCGTGIISDCTGYLVNGSCYNGTWVNETVCTDYCNNCPTKTIAPSTAFR